MCIPVAALAIASAAVGTVGTVVGAVAQAQQANYQASIADQNAKIAASQANDAVQNTNLEALRRSRQNAQVAGQQQAAMAANGVDLNFGSAVDVQKDTKMFGAEDLSQIYKQGNENARGFDISGFNYRSQAAASRAAASGALIGGAFGALGTALGGATQVAKLKKQGF